MKGLAEGLRTCVFLTTGAVLETEPVLPAVDGDEVLLLVGGDDLSIGEGVLFVAGDTEASVFVMDVCCCCC